MKPVSHQMWQFSMSWLIKTIKIATDDVVEEAIFHKL